MTSESTEAKQFIKESIENLSTFANYLEQLPSGTPRERADLLRQIQSLIYAFQGGAGFFNMPNVVKLSRAINQWLPQWFGNVDELSEEMTVPLQKTHALLLKVFKREESTYAKALNQLTTQFSQSETATSPKASATSANSSEPSEIQIKFIEEILEGLNALKDETLLEENITEKKGLVSSPLETLSRIVGTIKGTSGFLGLNALSKIANPLEKILRRLEKNELSLSASLQKVLVESKHRLIETLHAQKSGQAVDTQETITKLNQILNGLSINLEKSSKKEEAKSVEKPATTFTKEKEDTPKSKPDVKETTSPKIEKPKPDKPNKFKEVRADILPMIKERQEVSEIVQEFITEAQEHADILEDRLLQLEEQRNSPSREIIDDLFRAAHSIKGGAGFFGMVKVSKVSHLMENTLEDLRTEKQECTPEMISLLLKGVDLLRILLKHPDDDSSIDIVPFLEGRIDEIAVSSPALGSEGSSKDKRSETSSKTTSTNQFESSKTKETATSSVPSNISSIRVSTALLNRLMALAGELVLIRNQQLQVMDLTKNEDFKSITQRLNLVTSELQEGIMRTRMQSVNNVFSKFPRIVRDLSRKLGKKIDLKVEGQEVELDRTILESLSDPLTHLIRNSVDHGIEHPEVRREKGKRDVGQIQLRAHHEEGMVLLEIIDDGGGIAQDKIKKKALEKELFTKKQLENMPVRDVLQLIFHPGFSTAEQVTDVSGRGVGMDVVRQNIEKIGGFINLTSQEHKGTRIEIRLPLTLAIMPTLVVKNQEQRYAIPQTELVEVVCLNNEEIYEKIEIIQEAQFYRLREELLPLANLTDVLGCETPLTLRDSRKIVEEFRQQRTLFKAKKYTESNESSTPEEQKMIIVLRSGIHQFGLIADQVLDTEEIVVKPLHSHLKDCDCFSGATIMGDGQVALILDVAGVARHSGIQFQTILKEQTDKKVEEESQNLLFFHAGKEEQFAVPLPLISRVEQILRKDIERIGERELITIHDMVYRVLHLDEIMNVSAIPENTTELYLLVMKHAPRPCGILVQSLIDIAAVPSEMSLEDCFEPGTMGSFIFEGNLTIYLDLFAMLDLIDPEWFQSKITLGRKGTVLLVEPSPMYQTVISGYLKHDKHKVVGVSSAEDAIYMLESGSKFDLILVQMDTDITDGSKIPNFAKNDFLLQNVPILALSQKQKASELKEMGFDIVIEKLSRSILMDYVKKILGEEVVA